MTCDSENCTRLQHIYTSEFLVLWSLCAHTGLLGTMASQHPGRFPPSPTKKSSKRPKCHPGGDVDGSSRPSKSKKNKPCKDSWATGGTEENASHQEPRRSGRTGAGTGGRVVQLEKVGTALEERSVRPQKVTTIPESLPDNPLAPPKKQRRRKAKASYQCLQKKDEMISWIGK